MTTVVSSTDIMVTWDVVPPMDQNGNITQYEVLYKPLETFNRQISTQTMIVSGSEMSLILMNLEEFVSYNISIRAYTSAGEGPYSNEITATTLQDGKYLCK